jgi:hypothetical protein
VLDVAGRAAPVDRPLGFTMGYLPGSSLHCR